jgi:multiple sugar transport system substrate-binding protein
MATPTTLQKVLAAIAGGKPPDISYLYGSWAANIATSPAVVNLTQRLAQDKSFGWNHFWQVEREVATVNGKVVGVPALVDNLALVYNKKLFAQAGLSPATANWTWSDFENAAIKLTDPSKKQFGWAYVNDGSEDTRVAVLGDAVAGGWLDPVPRRQAGGV